MDLSKLNPAEWIKGIFKELENIRYCYFLAYLVIYSLLLLFPPKLEEKLELLKYINILSLLAIFSLVILFGRIINFISLKFEKHLNERNILKYLKTLNPDELRALSLGVVCNQQTVYMNFQDSAGESLLYKGLIIKCVGKQDYEGAWPYIIPDFVWNKIIKNPIFHKQTADQILSIKKETNQCQ
ncbi:MAG TPA: super-infection exclusion protein B [Candidatus Gastranaerophilales bacterium]|nr:super-infection exclusion protein B [Candidatus Gastranaerophilales bacterium]